MGGASVIYFYPFTFFLPLVPFVSGQKFPPHTPSFLPAQQFNIFSECDRFSSPRPSKRSHEQRIPLENYSPFCSKIVRAEARTHHHNVFNVSEAASRGLKALAEFMPPRAVADSFKSNSYCFSKFICSFPSSKMRFLC